MAKIAIVLGSIRKGRAGEPVARWAEQRANGRAHTYELVDLKDYPLPLLDSPVVPGQAKGSYDNPAVQRWADKMGEFDAFVFVTPEYNRSVPGPFKNAFDSIAAEWVGKPIAFVGYGFESGVNAISAWKQATSGALKMKPAEKSTQIFYPDNFGDNGFAPTNNVKAQLDAMLDELEASL